MKSRVVVVAVIESNGKVLLGKKRRNTGPYPNSWVIPGGGVNLGEESIIDALKREVREETGLELKDIEKINFDEDFEPNKKGDETHYIFLAFRAVAVTENAIANDDLAQLKWFEKSELNTLSLSRPSIKLFKELKYIDQSY